MGVSRVYEPFTLKGIENQKPVVSIRRLAYRECMGDASVRPSRGAVTSLLSEKERSMPLLIDSHILLGMEVEEEKETSVMRAEVALTARYHFLLTRYVDRTERAPIRAAMTRRMTEPATSDIL